jgi:hypothetical protein
LKPARHCNSLSDCDFGLTPQCAHSGALSEERQKEHHMHATIRRYEGVDAARTNEVAGKVNETLVPELRQLPGFAGYYLIEAGNGVLSSLSLFQTSEQADESTKVVAKWITDESLKTAIPNEPKITNGRVVARSNGIAAVA